MRPHRRHGLRHHDLYKIHLGMMHRCYNPKNPNFRNYGKRGIVMCKRWHKVENFIEDMYPRPSKNHSLDRINNDGNYSPGNCRWATDVEQCNNMRKNKWVKFRGKSMTVAQWARELGISRMTLKGRLRRGWTMARASIRPNPEFKNGYRK